MRIRGNSWIRYDRGVCPVKADPGKCNAGMDIDVARIQAADSSGRPVIDKRSLGVCSAKALRALCCGDVDFVPDLMSVKDTVNA